jgi:tRNA (guanine-N7-)-methyltransferase
MARKKLLRIQAASSLQNVLDSSYVKNVVDNNKKLVIELGCGDGLFAVEYARRNLDAIVIGLDIKLDRLFKAGSNALDLGLENCFFSRMKAEDLLEFIPAGSVSELWLTFSDPQPKKGNAKKRLTHTRFLKIYNQLLSENGTVCFKSDSDLLYSFTLEQLSELNIVPGLNVCDTHLHLDADSPYLIETVFEKKFREKGIKIKALEWHRIDS